MSGSTSGDYLRQFLANEENSLILSNYTQSETDYNGSGAVPLPTTDPGYLYIDLANGNAGGDVFVPAGYGFIENVNDTSPIIGSANTGDAPVLFYLGDSGGQTFYSGNSGSGADYIAMTGFGNLAVTSNATSGTYVVATGLQAAGVSLQTLAAPAYVNGVEQGNTVVAGGGQVSIAAGLGANLIFLGTGNDYVASEGTDTLVGGSGAATIDAATSGIAGQSALVYGNTGALTFYGGATPSTIVGDPNSNAGALQVFGGTGSVTAYGGAGSNELAGGTGGNNLLIAGAGNSTLFGGGAGDTLVANGASSTLIAGGGAETLYGSASGTDAMFGGSGSDLVVLGSAQTDLTFGTDNDTVFAGNGGVLFSADTAGGGFDMISGFNASLDFFGLDTASGATGASIVANDTVSGGNTTFEFSSSTTVELLGFTNLTANSFIS